MSENKNLEFLDILAIISFAIQMQNQSKIFGISDFQEELNKVVKEIHAHLENQDEKLSNIERKLQISLHQDTNNV